MIVKTIVTVMQKYAEEVTKEQQEGLSLSSLALEDEVIRIREPTFFWMEERVIMFTTAPLYLKEH